MQGVPCTINLIIFLNYCYKLTIIFFLDYDENDGDYSAGDGVTKPPKQQKANRKSQSLDEENAYFNRLIIPEFEKDYRSCDKKANLYILQQNLFLSGINLPSEAQSNCSR